MNTDPDSAAPRPLDSSSPGESQLADAQLIDAQLFDAQLVEEPLDATPLDATPLGASPSPAPANWWRDGTGRPRIVWRLALLGAGFFAAQLGTALVVALLLFGYWISTQAATDLRSERTVERYVDWLQTQDLALMGVSTLLTTPLLLGYVCLLRRFVDRRTIRSLGFLPAATWWTSVPAGTAYGGLLIGVGALVVGLLGGYSFAPASAVAWSEVAQQVLVLMPVLILAAFQEEFLIRGYVLRNFADLDRPRLGLALSSLIFWLLHGLNPAAWTSPWVGVNLFLAGWLLGMLYLGSRNLWFPTAVHFAWNFTQGPLLGIPVSGLELPSLWVTTLDEGAPSWLTGGPFGLEGSAVCAAIQCVIILAMSTFTRKNRVRGVGSTSLFWLASLGVAASLFEPSLPVSSCVAFAAEPAENAAALQRIGVDASSRTSQAVVASRRALAHTAQLLPLDAAGKLVAPGDVAAQTKQAFQNVSRALAAGGSSPAQLIKLNVYVADDAHGPAVARSLAELLVAGSEPATSLVTTRLPGGALVALDAIGAVASVEPASDLNATVAPRRVDGLAGDARLAHVAVLPAGGRVDIAGQAEKGDLATATRRTLESLRRTLEFLGQSDADIVQLKSFVKPMADVAASEAEFKKFFGDRPVPPLVFVEWESTLPIEIELVARAKPLAAGASAPRIEYSTPPGMTTSPVYSRVARAYSDRTIYFAGLFAREPGDGAAQVVDLFAQLTDLASRTGTDLRHLTKATYYVSDDDPSRKLNELRPKYYDPQRPPTASKAVVRGTGRPDRSITLDMIAVPAAK